MTLDDIKKLATSGTVFNLDRMIAPKIIKMLYLFGLGGIGLWSIRHLFGSFAESFGAGLWGVLEIGIVGIGSFVLLRVICEALLVFFKKNEEHITLASSTRPAMSIFDDVKDALEELADDDEVDFVEQKTIEPAPKKAPAKKPAAKRAPVRKRTTRAAAKPKAK